MTQSNDPTRGTGDGPDGEIGAADYGYSGRGGFEEGNYSGTYGRGTAGAHDAPSASGHAGAGFARGGTEIPSPDVEGGRPVRADDPGDTNAQTSDDAGDGGVGGTGRTGGA
jgi:hypothetical protein